MVIMYVSVKRQSMICATPGLLFRRIRIDYSTCVYQLVQPVSLLSVTMFRRSLVIMVIGRGISLVLLSKAMSYVIMSR